MITSRKSAYKATKDLKVYKIFYSSKSIIRPAFIKFNNSELILGSKVIVMYNKELYMNGHYKRYEIDNIHMLATRGKLSSIHPFSFLEYTERPFVVSAIIPKGTLYWKSLMYKNQVCAQKYILGPIEKFLLPIPEDWKQITITEYNKIINQDDNEVVEEIV